MLGIFSGTRAGAAARLPRLGAMPPPPDPARNAAPAAAAGRGAAPRSVAGGEGAGGSPGPGLSPVPTNAGFQVTSPG